MTLPAREAHPDPAALDRAQHAASRAAGIAIAFRQCGIERHATGDDRRIVSEAHATANEELRRTATATTRRDALAASSRAYLALADAEAAAHRTDRARARAAA